VFKGELTFDGQLKNGDIKGGKLTVGSKARVEGNVETETLTLHGTVKGDVLVTGKCDLKGSANLVGSLTTNRLAMDEGATLIARPRSRPKPKNVPPRNQRVGRERLKWPFFRRLSSHRGGPAKLVALWRIRAARRHRSGCLRTIDAAQSAAAGMKASGRPAQDPSGRQRLGFSFLGFLTSFCDYYCLWPYRYPCWS